jgi:hypothetical protein
MRWTNEAAVSLIGVYFFIILMLSRLKTPSVGGHAIYLFRAFFPSWKFFEDYGDVPALFYRLGANSEQLGEWIPCLTRPKRRLSSLLMNGDGNFYLACTSLLQQVVAELEDIEEADIQVFDTTVLYQLTHNLVRFQISQQKEDFLKDRVHYQFKVCSGFDDLPELGREDVLISKVYVAQGATR